MNVTAQQELFPVPQTLAAAIRPKGNRDDAGVRGENHHKLADAIEDLYKDDVVTDNAACVAVSVRIEEYIKSLAIERQEPFRQQHAQMIKLLSSLG